MKNSLLARFAESLFWLARYMERAEGLARILLATSVHARDEHGVQDWAVILEMNGDLGRFSEQNAALTARAIVQFYVLDPKNPGSMVSSLTAARENARSLRHLISTEMWTQINILHADLKALRKRDVTPQKLAGVCGRVKEGCQTHTGITEGTLYRDHAADFYWVGKSIERADQISRLIDIGFHRAQLAEKALGEAALDTHWNAMLRGANGYQAFRRTRGVNLVGHEVVQFLMRDRHFPRSLLTCLDDVLVHLDAIQDTLGNEAVKAPMGPLEDLRAEILMADVPALMGSGLHDFLDLVQRRLLEGSGQLGRACFGHAEPVDEAA